jgi:hypothetical protein
LERAIDHGVLPFDRFLADRCPERADPREFRPDLVDREDQSRGRAFGHHGADGLGVCRVQRRADPVERDLEARP